MLGYKRVETVLEKARRGEIPAIRLPGGAIRFRETELDAWLNAHATGERPASVRDAERSPPR
jgi:excisionase family DNA binding protein